jgi:hypothetical protein
MLSIDKDGVISDARIKVELIPQISHGPLKVIDAIVVHQTDSSTAKGTLAEYRTGAKGTGAHLLIDQDGTLYQTVSLHQKCWHVGPIISKCYQKHSCVPKDEEYYRSFSKLQGESMAAMPEQWINERTLRNILIAIQAIAMP